MTRNATLIILALMASLFVACGSPEKSRDAFYDKAQQHLDAGRTGDAIIELKNALKVDPKFAKGHALMGRALLRETRLQEAFKSFAAAVELDPENLDARAQMGKLFLSAGQLDMAQEQADFILERQKEHIEGLLIRATVVYRKGFEAQGVDMLREIFTKTPDNEEAAYLLFTALKAKSPAEAEQILLKSIAANPKTKALRLHLATLYQEQARFGDAERQLVDLTRLDPENTALNLLLVKLHLQAKQDDKAVSTLEELVKNYPDNEEYRLGMAQVFYNRGEKDKAKAYLEKSIKDIAKAYQIRLFLAETLLKEGDPAGGEKLLKETIALDEHHPKALSAKLMLAESTFGQGRAAEALGLVEQVLERNPDDLNGHFLRGRIHLSKSRAQDAISDFRQVLKQQPDMHAASGFLAQAHFMNNEPQQGLDILQGLLKKDPGYIPARQALVQYYQRRGELDKALAELDQILSRQPDRLDIKLAIGDIHASRGDTDKARKVFEGLLANEDTEVAGHVKLGVLDMTRQSYAPALAHFDKALAKNQDIPSVVEAKVAALMFLNKQPEAVRFLQGLLAKNPKNALAHDLLGRLAAQQGDKDKAMDSFMKAIEINPGWLPPYYRIAALYVADNRIDQGIDHFQKLMAAQPDSLAYELVLATLSLEKRDFQQAEAHYTSILKRSPNFLPAANNLAYLKSLTSQSQDELRRALEIIQPALETGEPSALDTAGWLHYRLGNQEMALETLTKAIQANPNNPTIVYHMAKVLADSGNTAKARELLEIILKSEAKFLERGDAQALMNTLSGPQPDASAQ